jgi:hypothetical protein
MMARAPVVNHSDGELRLLEQLVGRTQAPEPRTGSGAGVG